MGYKLVMVPEQQRASKRLYKKFLQAREQGYIPQEISFKTLCQERHLHFDKEKFIMFCVDEKGNFLAVIPPEYFAVDDSRLYVVIRQSYDGGLYIGVFEPVSPWEEDMMRQYARKNIVGVRPLPGVSLPSVN